MRKKEPLPNFRDTRLDAGLILSRYGNRLKLIEAVLVCLLPIVLSVLLAQLFQILKDLSGASEALLFLMDLGTFFLLALWQLFVTLPLFWGILRMAAHMARGEEVALSMMFAPFSKRALYRKTLKISLRPFFLTVLMVLVVRWTSDLSNAIEVTVVTAFLFAVLIVLEVLLWLWVLLRGFLVPYYAWMLSYKPINAWWENERRKKHFSRGGRMWLVCYVPWILLGFLTVGILLLADILPRMLVSYFLYANRLTEPSISNGGTECEQ